MSIFQLSIFWTKSTQVANKTKKKCKMKYRSYLLSNVNILSYFFCRTPKTCCVNPIYMSLTVN